MSAGTGSTGTGSAGTGKALRIGLVGAGQISGAYLRTLPRLANVQVTAIADLDEARAAAAAEATAGARALGVADLLAADDVDLVLNLTIPAAHAEVAQAAIAAGKHVYGEKPLAATTGQAQDMLVAAARAGVRVGCAPDTVLGTGTQTARASLDAGEIGTPVAATAFMTTPGHERWHPNPDFYYLPGGGPLLDMGPYYITALVTLLGPVRRAVGMSSTPRATRVIGRGPRAGTEIEVAVATHVTGVLEHANGALSTLVMSFDTWAGRLPRIEVYGTDGSLSVPDPNGFAGPVEIFRAGADDWAPVAEAAGYRGAARGYGVSDMATALVAGTGHRANGDLAYHVLEVMEALLAAAGSGKSVAVASSCERPAPVPFGARPDQQPARLLRVVAKCGRAGRSHALVRDSGFPGVASGLAACDAVPAAHEREREGTHASRDSTRRTRAGSRSVSAGHPRCDVARVSRVAGGACRRSPVVVITVNLAPQGGKA